MHREIKQYIKTWEGRCYSDGIPDEAPKEIDDMVPSYKRIAMAVLKNDLKLIGLSPPVSDYYSILKCIELNIVYKKSKRMTQQQQRDLVFQLTKTMIKKQSYVKGYGDKFRVMDSEHNPLQNIDRPTMRILELNGVVARNGLVWNTILTQSPFSIALDVKLPQRGSE